MLYTDARGRKVELDALVWAVSRLGRVSQVRRTVIDGEPQRAPYQENTPYKTELEAKQAAVARINELIHSLEVTRDGHQRWLQNEGAQRKWQALGYEVELFAEENSIEGPHGDWVPALRFSVEDFQSITWNGTVDEHGYEYGRSTTGPLTYYRRRKQTAGQ
jgi:hypothetical protein